MLSCRDCAVYAARPRAITLIDHCFLFGRYEREGKEKQLEKVKSQIVELNRTASEKAAERGRVQESIADLSGRITQQQACRMSPFCHGVLSPDKHLRIVRIQSECRGHGMAALQFPAVRKMINVYRCPANSPCCRLRGVLWRTTSPTRRRYVGMRGRSHV